MKFQKTVLGLHKVGVREGEIYELIKTALAFYSRKNVLDSLLPSLKKCIHLIIKGEATKKNKEIAKIERYYNALHVPYLEIDYVFCDHLVQMDLDKLDYIDYELTSFSLSKPYDKQTAVKLVKYVLRSCFSNPKADSLSKWMILSDVACYIHTLPINKLCKYVATLLPKKLISNEDIKQLGECMSTLLLHGQRGESFAQVMSLRHHVPEKFRSMFVDVVVSRLSTVRIPFEQYAQVISECLHEDVGSADILKRGLSMNLQQLVYENAFLDKLIVGELKKPGSLVKFVSSCLE